MLTYVIGASYVGFSIGRFPTLPFHNMHSTSIKWGLTTLAAAMLAACGGGGGGDSASTPFSTPALSFTAPGSTYDLANYSQTGNFALPADPDDNDNDDNLLAAEASGITYNRDTGTLFVIGDGATAIVQISKTDGHLIDTMTLDKDDFEDADTEGITYVGGGKFAMVEERSRTVDLFTYAPGTTLTRAQVQSIALGTNVGNIGLEGISFDPSATNGFLFVKEKFPEGLFRTTLDFAAHSSSNGVPGTEPANLFDPNNTGMQALNDIFALSNILPTSAPDYDNLVVIGAASGQIVKMNRAGKIASTLPMDSGAQNEGVTMGADGTIYAVGEHAGPGGVTGLTIFSPTVDKSAVGAGSNFYLTFNQPVQAGAGNIVISSDTDTRTIPVTDTQQVSFAGNTVKINPRANLVGGKAYSVTYAAGVFKNAAGADAPAQTNTATFAFTVSGTPDAVAPTLVSSAPADGVTNVGVSRIALTFSESVQAGSGSIQITGADGDNRTIPVDDPQVKFVANIARINLTTPLHPNVVYTFTFAAGNFTDLSGNAFAGVTRSFTTGTVGGPPPKLLITEVNSNASAGGDFFELYNYGATAIDISHWRWGDDHLDFALGANTVEFPAGTIINAGERLVVVNTTDEAAFRTAWNNLPGTVNVAALGGAGLGGGDIVVLYDSAGQTMTWFNFEGDSPAPFVSPEDGVTLTPAVASAGVTAALPNHAGKAFGGNAKASAVWDTLSTAAPTYKAAVAGDALGSFSQAGDANSAGSPGQ